MNIILLLLVLLNCDCDCDGRRFCCCCCVRDKVVVVYVVEEWMFDWDDEWRNMFEVDDDDCWLGVMGCII